MSERYVKLFSMPENLYAEGSPLLIAAGALLKDNETGRVLAQLKLRNLSEKTVKAVTVRLSLFDTVGKSVGEPLTHQYLDLAAGRDADFAQKSAIPIPDASVRGFSVCVTEIIFQDNEIRTLKNDALWSPLNAPKALEDALGEDAELQKQFRLRYGAKAKNLYTPQRGLWFCVCGTLNRQEEAECRTCGAVAKVLSAFSEEGLREECALRLAKEAKEKAEKQERQKKQAKRAIRAASAAVACIACFLLVTKVFIPMGHYSAAVKLMEAGEYDEAIAAFEAMDGYRDSEEQIIACHYNAALDLMEAGEYDKAIAAFKALDGYAGSEEKIKESEELLAAYHYDFAVKLMEAGKYDKAIAAFKALDGYEDSEAQIAACKPKTLKTAEVGGSVFFGTYQGEDIEWRVLAKENGKVFVISEYGLDWKPYNENFDDVTWETCTLRKWLNGEFLNTAFSEEEQARIATTTVSADRNPEYGANPGNATNDKVFLLSIAEAEKYFEDDEDRRCAPTAYVKEQGVYVNDYHYRASGEATCWWWLRSPGGNQKHAASVSSDGSVDCNGDYVDCDYDDVTIRPALWINPES